VVLLVLLVLLLLLFGLVDMSRWMLSSTSTTMLPTGIILVRTALLHWY
jgi:hypothetical protein